MAHIRDFEPILPDPQPYVEKALALYERAVREKRGRLVFIAAELGGGKTDVLNALAQALHRVKPEPNFVVGSFRGGEYHPQTLDWQAKVCFKKAVLAVGETAALLGFLPGLYAFSASFIGQLLKTGASAQEVADEFKNQARPGKESADWLRELLRRTAEHKPLVCLLDDWDEAQRFYWDDMLLSFALEIARDLPLLLFLTVKEPINLAAPEKDESGLTMVIKTLTEKGVAEWWPLQKLSRDEVANNIGQAAPGIAAKLHGVTGGNARWVRELWREWRLNEIVVMNEADCWIWGAQHKPTINLYDDILRDRLTRLLNAETAMRIEEAREVLACGALEGTRFTADAVALTLDWDRDELIDFLDEKLVQSEDNPDGVLLEEDNVKITRPDGATRTLWRYRFVSELHWLALERYGFANDQRPEKSDSERLEKTATLAKALEETYAPEERLAAVPLARLFRDIGSTEVQHYQRMAYYSADREVMRKHALHLMALNTDDWEAWRCSLAAELLIQAGNAMLEAFTYKETQAVLEEANKLAHRAKSERTEAHALYLCGFAFWSEGDNKAARNYANDSLKLSCRLGEKGGTANSLHLLSLIDMAEGRFENARRQATQSFEIYQTVGHRSGAAASMHQLAEIDYREDRFADARRKAKQVLEFDQATGKQTGIATSLQLLAKIDHAESRYEDARNKITQGLKIYEEIGNRAGSACLLHQLADIDRREGRYDDARSRVTQSLAIDREIGNLTCTAVSLCVLAEIDKAEGRHDNALRQATQSFQINQQVGNRSGMVTSLNTLAKINYAAGSYDEARRQATQALEISQETGNRHKTANPLRRLAEINSVEGRYEDARRQATESLEICQEIGCRYGTASSLRALGRILPKLTRPKEAFDLMTIGVLILTEIELAEVQTLQNDLADLVAVENYGEAQLLKMNERLLDAYRQDSGKELIENTLARLREADR